MDDRFAGDEINSVDCWNKRFFEDWIANGGRLQTTFFAELCIRELPLWLIEDIRARKSSIFDYGCAVGDALPIWQRAFPDSIIRGGDVAQVGLGLARALHPDFEFADTNAVGDATQLADLLYCSNTLDHFEDWRGVLDRLARHAKEYLVIMVPFEEEDRIEEHPATFEFDSLPVQLSAGIRLVHLTVVDAAAEPQPQWKGRQLIAIYGKEGRGRDRLAAQSVLPAGKDTLVFDLRGMPPSGMAPLLGNLAAMSREKRQLLAELAQAAKLEELRALAMDRITVLEATFRGALREYGDLTRGTEGAQRRVIDALTTLDPALLTTREISPVAEDWPVDLADADATHRLILGRLIDVMSRANHLASSFHDQASRWLPLRRELTQRLQWTRHAMERAVGERDRADGQLRDLAEVAATAAAPRRAEIAAPLVSILLPVYNQAYLVDEAIAGVLSQTYRNWELIVLDDGSTDDLADRVRHYLGDRRVLFLRQPNQRLPAALNHGFAHARGELLTWTSADNIMLPSQLERLVAELAAHPDVGLVYSDYWAINDKGEPLDDAKWRRHNRDPEIADLIRLPDSVTIENFHRSGDNFIGASFLYRRTAAAIVGDYADAAFGGEDYDFWLRMHLVTAFRHVAEPLYKYRVHDDTLTARAEELGLFDNIRELLEADRWRIETLLGDAGMSRGPGLLRPVEQFHAAVLRRCRPIAYRRLVERDRAAALEPPVVVDIDLPARAIDRDVLRRADLLLCRSELTAALLGRDEGLRGKRVFTWQGEPTPAIRHAYIQAFADQVTAPVTAPPRRVWARVDEPFQPTRILILVERWSSGGLENIVIDLAESLAASGRSVVVAAAHGAPPPAAAFGRAPIRTLSLRGDEDVFDNLLRREAIEIVNYHHGSFAAELASRLAVATLYTMHNCDLGMDDGARAQVSRGLDAMDGLIAVSRQVAQFAVARFSFPADRIVVVPNGLREELTVPATRSAVDGDGRFTVAMVASLSRPKLQHVAVAAFAEAARQIPALRLRLIGMPLDPAYHDELKAQIAALPEGHRIELIAGLSRAETIAALADAHVFLLPSLLEGCSMALLEAVAEGCVCVVSDVGNARGLHCADGSVVLLPSPLGELDTVTRQQFLAAAAAPLPDHQANIAEALRNVWRDYGAFAAGIEATGARLRETSGMQQMTDAYLLAYTMARRGAPRRSWAPQETASGAVEAGTLSAT